MFDFSKTRSTHFRFFSPLALRSAGAVFPRAASVRRAIALSALVLVLAVPMVLGIALVDPAAAQDRRQNEPGQFDFYVLALSWSPSFCNAVAERAAARAGQTQGTAAPTPAPAQASQPGSSGASRQQTRRSQTDLQCGERRYSFVVHGLWPQYERGFPEFCQVPAPRLNYNIVSGMLDLMPSPRLIFREWDRHGTCSGQSARAYFDNVRKAHAIVKIPPEYLDLKSALTVTPDEVADAFVKANPGLTRAGISVSCDSKRLNEVRLCLNKDFGFRDCTASLRRACRRDKLEMPPVRGG